MACEKVSNAINKLFQQSYPSNTTSVKVTAIHIHTCTHTHIHTRSQSLSKHARVTQMVLHARGTPWSLKQCLDFADYTVALKSQKHKTPSEQS